MTDIGYAPDVGKRGPKPQRGEAKLPYATRLPREHIEFLRSEPNGAAFIENAIDVAIRRRARAAQARGARKKEKGE